MNEKLIRASANRFLRCFDAETQEAILEYCKRVSKTKADVFILMARKAACLCLYLQQVGLLNLNGRVVTSRVLDIDNSWLADKRVAILDDAIISGTTLYRVIEHLDQCGVSEVTIHALTVNEQYFKSELLSDDAGKSLLDPSYRVLPNGECVSLCHDVVDALSAVPLPYDIDYPAYDEVRLSANEYRMLLSVFGWSVFDMTSLFQREQGVFSHTFVPAPELLASLADSMNCAYIVEGLSKVRAYGRRDEGDPAYVRVRFVPMVVLSELAADEVDAVFRTLVSQLSDCDVETFGFSSTAKLRFVQYALAIRLMHGWLDAIDASCNLSITLVSSFDEALLFGAHFAERIDFSGCWSATFGMPCGSDESVSSSTVVQALIGCDEYSRYEFEEYLLQPFLNLYYEKELPCRKLIEESGKQAFDTGKYDALLNRLMTGYSFSQLCEHLETMQANLDSNICKLVTSLFLDDAIDAGIVVPVVEEKDGCVYRSYRHGEDVLFGERERTMYTYMLSQFEKNMSNWSYVAKTITEKLFVLFTKVGLRQRFLTPYHDNFSVDAMSEGVVVDVLRIKTDLHGPTAYVGRAESFRRNADIPYVTNEDKHALLTATFCRQGYLSLRSDGLGYNAHDERIHLDNISERDKSQVVLFSTLMADACGKHHLDGDSLMKIACCVTPEDVVVALAHEVIEFYEDLENLKLFASGASYGPAEYAATIAVASAVKKLNAYESGEARELMVGDFFEDPMRKEEWKLYFGLGDVGVGGIEKESLEWLFNRMKAWVLSADLAVQFLNYYCRNENAEGLFASVAEERYREALSAYAAFGETDCGMRAYSEMRLERIDVFCDELMNGGLQSEEAADMLIGRFSDGIREKSALLNDICMMLGKRGRAGEIIVGSVTRYYDIACICWPKSRSAGFAVSSVVNQGIIKLRQSGDSASIVSSQFTPMVDGFDACWIVAREDLDEGSGVRLSRSSQALLELVISCLNKLACNNLITAKGTVFAAVPKRYAVVQGAEVSPHTYFRAFYQLAARFNDAIYPADDFGCYLDFITSDDEVQRMLVNCIESSQETVQERQEVGVVDNRVVDDETYFVTPVRLLGGKGQSVTNKIFNFGDNYGSLTAADSFTNNGHVANQGWIEGDSEVTQIQYVDGGFDWALKNALSLISDAKRLVGDCDEDASVKLQELEDEVAQLEEGGDGSKLKKMIEDLANVSAIGMGVLVLIQQVGAWLAPFLA